MFFGLDARIGFLILDKVFIKECPYFKCKYLLNAIRQNEKQTVTPYLRGEGRFMLYRYELHLYLGIHSTCNSVAGYVHSNVTRVTVVSDIQHFLLFQRRHFEK